ncbi:hypothetical protein SLEP1_g9445 [Rubroshorea leprosula]|uniref:Transposase (putative) gypsy type domain-containing protein n=1 Tax=Rubroshorea leprosula TaxID=152421 RepID=A0AAV5IAY1_9ROSI|nr:hypothetical protein SLEP1_g9445 [Rubroshorea leprosula]
MDFFRELRELRGNQGKEEEEEGLISVEPIAMIVPPALQDLPEMLTPESSASLSVRDNGGDHHTSSSNSSSSEETPSHEEGIGNVVGNNLDLPVVEEWENRVLTGRLSNLHKAPKDLPAGFRFKAALHHEVVYSAPSISGYKKLEEMVKAYHISRTLLLRAGAKNERACTVSQTGWIPVYVDHFDAGLRFPLLGLIFDLLADDELALTQLMPNSIRFIIGFMLLCAKLEIPTKAIVFRSLFQCQLCPNSRGAKWYYLSGREKSQLLKNVKNKVVRWKRLFVFVRDTRTERISNDLAAQLSEWHVPNAHVNYPQLLPQDTDLKNQLLEYARRENLIDLEALVTTEQLAMFGLVDATNQFTEAIYWNASVNEPRAPEVAQWAAPRNDKHDSMSGRPQHHNHVARRTVDLARRPGLAPSRGLKLWPPVHAGVHVRRLTTKMRSPSCGAEQVWGLSLHRWLNLWPCSSNAPSAMARAAAKPTSASTSVSAPKIAYPNGFSYVKANFQPAMVQGMQSFVPPVDCQRARTFVQQHGVQVAMVKLMDAFNYVLVLFESEQGARSQNNELSDSWPQKRPALWMMSIVCKARRWPTELLLRRAKQKSSRAGTLSLGRSWSELASKKKVAEAARNLNAAEEALNELKTSHRRSISIARAQGVEWLIGSTTFQDTVVMASANMTMEIYNEIRGKGKSLAPLTDTTVQLRWDLNDEGVLVWPPSILEEGEDLVGLPSFDGWVEGAPVAEQEPSTTPPSSQPTVVPARSPVNAPAPEPTARSSPARSSPTTADVSMPVDLTDD